MTTFNCSRVPAVPSSRRKTPVRTICGVKGTPAGAKGTDGMKGTEDEGDVKGTFGVKGTFVQKLLDVS